MPDSFPIHSRTIELLRHLSFRTVSEACDRNAETDGERVALIDAGGTGGTGALGGSGGTGALTWAEVKTTTDALARGLLLHGIGRDDRVLIQLPNGTRLFLARVACEKAGVKAVPVPVGFRRAELQALVAHTRPRAVITQAAFRRVDLLQTWAGIMGDRGGDGDGLERVFAFDAGGVDGWLTPIDDLLRAGAGAGAGPEAGARFDLERTRFTVWERSFIATTSGSTGLPKCVDVAARARLLTGLVHLWRFGVRPGDTLMALTPITGGTSEAMVFLAGPHWRCRLVFLGHFSVEEMCAVVERHGVNVAIGVPTMLTRLVDAAPDPRRLRSLRCFVNHGAALPLDIARQFETVYDCKIVQAYGATDFGGITATRIEDPFLARVQTVGPPLDGNEVQIRRPDGSPANTGETGTLWVRGVHASGEYYRNPALTAQVWREGWYGLGDVGYADAAGRLVLTGREKDVIIRGGQNIFPAELEDLVTGHPAVLEAAMVPYPDRELGERVCACVVLKAGCRMTLPDLASFLRDKGVATFKLPERLLVLPDLPRVPGGTKVDKKALAQEAVT